MRNGESYLSSYIITSQVEWSCALTTNKENKNKTNFEKDAQPRVTTVRVIKEHGILLRMKLG